MINISEHHGLGVHFALLLPLTMFFLLSSGCSECKTDADCSEGEVCSKGKCVSKGDEEETDSAADSETGSAATGTGQETGRSSDPTPTDPDGGVDADTDGDSDTDSEDDTPEDSDSETGSDGQPCRGIIDHGNPCVRDCDCRSGHCGDGFCCDSGECCSSAADCDETLCVQYYCSGDNQCNTNASIYECGSEDLADGDTCENGMRCDGFGNCVTPVIPDCSPFALQEEFTCEEGAVQASCYTQCTEENQAVTCAEDAVCIYATCVWNELFANGAVCSLDNECRSGHCGDGFCCNDGECCQSAEDCDDSLCGDRPCVDNECVYESNEYSCGQEDTGDGDVCTGATLCNGLGDCLSVNACAGAYTGTGDFVCTADAIVEECHTSCTSISQCSDGYRCDNGACVPGTVQRGGSCRGDTDCISGHCGDGFCCEAGECCAEDADCDDTLCNARVCDPNSQCDTTSTTGCGFEDDAVGDTCTGDNRCDGYGNCVSVIPCNGPFSKSGNFTCEVNQVAETCRTTCANIADCNAGYFCEAPDCVSMGPLPDGAACADGADCDSGHCEGGICCASEECCLTASDCDNDLCRLAYCTGRFVCAYYDIEPCGTADSFGNNRCDGTSLCDGQGGCAAVDTCEGAFAFDGSYACGAGTVQEGCFGACVDDDECNEGFTCTDNTCVPRLSNGEGVCTANRECESGYCTASTGICCDGGLCCDDDDDCGDFDCDFVTSSCVFSCDDGSGDDDALCANLGDFHCDNGTCFEDMLNGEGPCDENSDCASGYCDLSSGVCCDSGSCCADDDDCGGFTCNVDFHCVSDCSPSGVEDDGLCGSDYHCNGDTCVADMANGDGGCVEDSDCASGNCNELSGVCCSVGEGDCCNSPSHCDDGNLCTRDLCSVLFHCYSVPQNENEECSDGEFCNGLERCDSEGNCVAESVPCEDAPANPCDVETCFDCAATTCDEVDDECVDTPINEGQPCTDREFCIGSVSRVCENGLCVDPGTGSPPCTGSTNNECTEYICNEETDGCDLENMVDGWPCDDGNPCTGDNQCQGGFCAPAEVPPCEDGDPCTKNTCTPNGDVAECDDPVAIGDGELCEGDFVCFGTAPRCFQGECIAKSDHPCNDGSICTVHECEEQYYADFDCGETALNDPYPIACGDTTPLTDAYTFKTREYFTYNATCPNTYDGMEAVVVLETDNAGTVDISVTNVSPSMDIDILQLTDWCDPSTCVNAGTGSLTATVSPGAALFVLEASSPLPPQSLDVVVGSCP